MSAAIVRVLSRWRVMGAVILGATLALAGTHRPILIFNASASAPVGFYRVLPAGPIQPGDLVLVPAPARFAAIAARRGYLPRSVPLVKRIAATAGATVCAFDRRVTIDGRYVADQLVSDREGRGLPGWSGCRRVLSGEIFLLMAGVPDSFDSRYFGPVREGSVIGRLSPLWVH